MPLFIQGGSLGRIVTVLLGIEASAAVRILLVNFPTQSSLDKFSKSQLLVDNVSLYKSKFAFSYDHTL